MIRNKLTSKTLPGERHFHWRGGDVSRLENLTDVVFGFGLTLSVVSLKAPDSYAELMDGFRQWPAFAATFLFLVWCWTSHFLFHRRFGLEDAVTNFLNVVFLLVILTYIYPLRFLAGLLLRAGGAQGEPVIRGDEVPELMLIYSAGILVLFLLLGSMNLYAYGKRDALGLDEKERLLTRASIRAHFLTVAISLLVFLVVALVPAAGGAAGLLFFLIPLTHFLNGFLTGRKVERLAGR